MKITVKDMGKDDKQPKLNGNRIPPGTELDLPDDLGEAWCKGGYAEPTQAAKKKAAHAAKEKEAKVSARPADVKRGE